MLILSMRNKWLILSLMLLMWLPVSAQILKTVSLTKIQAIELRTTGNKVYSLPLDKPAVVVFLSPDCPLSKNYAPVLTSLAKKHPGINFFGIFPGRSYSSEEISEYGKGYGLNFPLLSDPSKQLSGYMKAKVTPEVMLINPQGVILYTGLIDNWAVSLGKKRQVITNHYLEEAISSYESGRQITVSHTEPVGCLINDI